MKKFESLKGHIDLKTCGSRIDIVYNCCKFHMKKANTNDSFRPVLYVVYAPISL